MATIWPLYHEAMAVPARTNSLFEASPPGGGEGPAYGSLMGLGGAKKKKKPVLVLDAEELEKAHEAIAMGGAQIMDAADLAPAERPAPAAPVMLGLVPMGAEEDEAEEADEYGADEAEVAADVPFEETCIDAGLAETRAAEHDDSGEDADADEDEDADADEDEDEDEDEDALAELDEEAEPLPTANLDHLLRPGADYPDQDDDDDAASIIPSIEEQLKKMRALPRVQAAETSLPEADDAPAQPAPPAAPAAPSMFERAYAPEARPTPVSAPRSLPTPPTSSPPPPPLPPLPTPAWPEPPGEPPVAEGWTGGEWSEDAPAESWNVDDAPIPDAEPPAATVADSFAAHDFDPGPDFEPDPGPDLSWMMPEERRALEISEGQNSNLRARLVHSDETPAEDHAAPGLLARLWNWIASLWR